MQKYYIVGELKPLTTNSIRDIEQDVTLKLPKDYKNFLKTYGYGSVNEFLLINRPDKNYFKLNFSDYLDFWILSDAERKNICEGVLVASNIDGDIFLWVSNPSHPFVLVPRDSEQLTYFKNFDDLLKYTTDDLILNEELYFDSNYGYEQQYFNLIKDEWLDKNLVERVCKAFIKAFEFDKVIGSEQPKYFIKNIGGWVRFDLLYKNSIQVKYQKNYHEEAEKIIEYIHKNLDWDVKIE